MFRSATISKASDAATAIAPIFAISMPNAAVTLPVIFACIIAKWAYMKYKATYVFVFRAMTCVV